ncbi:MAG TPA: Rap1a/Tai family immunity protein [Acetobacteraceae bacterium]
MTRLVPPATAIALFLLPAAASAQRAIDLHARTAGELAQLCAANPRDPRGAAEITYCHGFAQGAADVLLETASGTKPFCFPNPAPTRTATLAQFVEWVRAVPDHARLPASRGLAQFLGERYPCK